MQSISMSLWQWRHLKCTKFHFNVLHFILLFLYLFIVNKKRENSLSSSKSFLTCIQYTCMMFSLVCAAASVQCAEKCRDRICVLHVCHKQWWLTCCCAKGWSLPVAVVTELEKWCWRNLRAAEQSNLRRSNYCCVMGRNKWSKPSYWSTFHCIAGTPSGWGFFN